MNKTIKIIVASVIYLSISAIVGISLGLHSTVYAFGTFTTPSPFGGVAYSAYYHNADKFSNCLILNGVDVSEYQSGAKSDWNTAKANAVEFSIPRVTWTGYGSKGNKYADENFSNHYQKGKAAGIMMGCYVFSQAVTEAEARAEAEYAVSKLKANNISPDDLELPVYMDYEFAGQNDGGRMYTAKSKGKFNKSIATACAKAFCETVESYGYEAGLYACTSFLNSYIDSSFGNTYDVWCAQYYNKCEYTGIYTKWQYSSAAKIPGINNTSSKAMNVDVNYWYLDPNRTSTESNDIASCNIGFENGESNFKYTGGAVTPTVTIKAGETPLVVGTHYRVSYFKNVNLGTGYAYIRGIGNYKGYKLLTFTIANAYENIGLSAIKSGERLNVSVSEQAASAGYSVDENNINGVIPGTTARAFNSIISLDPSLVGYTWSIVDAGTGAVIGESSAVSAGNLINIYRPANEGVGETEPVRVASLNINTNGAVSATHSVGAFYYDGGVKTPGITVNFGTLTVANDTTSGNEIINIAYPGGRQKPGTYVTYFSGNGMFEGVTGAASFDIIIMPTSIKSLSKKTAGFKATWYKQSKTYVSGYQIQYSRYSDMRLDLKNSISSYKTGSKTITKRYRKKTYYVRVRTYKTINKVKYYSEWSPIKTVKTK